VVCTASICEKYAPIVWPPSSADRSLHVNDSVLGAFVLSAACSDRVDSPMNVPPPHFASACDHSELSMTAPSYRS
jgi:hypothetical protein